jgi:hypothetical protein
MEYCGAVEEELQNSRKEMIEIQIQHEAVKAKSQVCIL